MKCGAYDVVVWISSGYPVELRQLILEYFVEPGMMLSVDGVESGGAYRVRPPPPSPPQRRVSSDYGPWTSCRAQCTRQAEPPSSAASSDSGGQRSCESDDGRSDGEAEVTYQCPCGKRFTRSTAYRRHLDVAHSNAESYKCRECGKTIIPDSGSHSRNPYPETSSISSQKDVIDSASSAEESTDKENHSPPHTPEPTFAPPSDSPLIQNEPAKHPGVKASAYDLDRSFPKSKPKTGNSEAVIVCGDSRSVIPAKYLSRCSGERSGFDGKVSIITINTDNSLISDNFIFQHGARRTGNLVVNPGSHSVIVIKTQNRNKTSPTSAGSSSTDKVVGDLAKENSCLLGDANSIRKSQRLQGKIPGWKQVLDSDEQVDQKSKRRRMAKVKVEDLANGYEIAEAEAAFDERPPCRRRESEAMDETGLSDGFGKRQRLASSSNKESCGTVKSGVFKCVMCDRSFESEKYLSMHMSLHKVDNSMESLMQQNNKDDEIEESTSTAVKNVKTPAVNANGAYWTCKICNKVFAQNSNYKNHIRTHSDERPFVCQICSIGFKERYHLKKHMLFKHSDELKEECRYCGKKFKDSTAVRAHERIHSDVRPYSCRRCGKSFKTSECLWHHENRSKTCGQALLGVPAPSPRFKRGRQSKKEVIKTIKTPPSAVSTAVLTSLSQQLMPGGSLLISDSLKDQSTAITTINHSSSSNNNSNISSLPQFTYSEVDAATASIHPAQPHNLVPVRSVTEPQLVKVHCKPIVAVTTMTTPAAAARPELVSRSSYDKANSPLSTTTSAVQTQTMSTCSTPNGAGCCSAVLVKVEPEVALPDYELTAMASSEGSYEDNRQEALLEEEAGIGSAVMMDAESGIADISHETILQLQEEIKKDPVLEDIELSLLEKSVDDDDLNMEDDDEDDDEDEDDDDDMMDEEYSDEFGEHSDDNYKLDGGSLTCEKCGKRLPSASAFDKHILTHSGLRPYICSLCNVAFKLKVHLKKHHLYRHSDEKPCECSICGKKFKDSSAVRLHERIHSTDRPFRCECGKTFKTRENLWGHRHRGPCEKKVKSEITSCATSDGCFLATACTDAAIYRQGSAPVYSRAQIRGRHVPAHAAINNRQIIARAVVQNSHVTAEATIADNGEVKASASISGPSGKMAVARVGSLDGGSGVRDGVKSADSPSLTASCPVRATETNPVLFARSQESRVSLPVLNVPSPAVSVPTAVVAPLKREVIAVPVNDVVIPSGTGLKPLKVEPTFNDVSQVQQISTPKKLVKAPTNNNNNNNNNSNNSSSCNNNNNNNNNNKTDTSLPPFETFSPTLRSKGPSLADRCPTIQKYLQMSQQPVKLPGIQQLFQSHSMGHDPGSAGLAAHVAMVQSLLPMRCRDPSAPLGPHPARGLHSPQTAPSLQSPATQTAHPCGSNPASPCRTEVMSGIAVSTSPRHPCSLLTHYSTTSLSQPTGHLIQNRLTPQKAGLRCTSPYPGSLPLLLPTDPSLASTYGDGPIDPTVVTAPTSLPSVTWDDEKKMAASNVWQMEQEQLFQDLTQTAGFGQL
ncbi:hypothetical protein LSH36_302g01000 [Paralvinella palmiformis]|uniref:C2H2-type domain-containing protein n=1 Tax=Paralvinella palmiformis TaxID=53620 RepID=A0AAD9N132_9ANNE|nr:hypothetical protein LSH36_302g01000 [Paralvinella palmiformis]